MASAKDLRKRIGTVKNTQQTTRAMKMVSAAKLRRAQEAILGHRPYAKRLADLIQTAISLPGAEVDSPLIRRKEDKENGTRKKILLVLVTSDRGLCGGFNGNVIKTAQNWVRSQQGNYELIQLGFVGKRGHDYFKTKKFNIGPYFDEVSGKVNFAKARKLMDALMELYLSGQVDEIKFIYNEFKNAVTQRVAVEDYLPLEIAPAPTATAEAAALPDYLVKPDLKQIIRDLLARNFSVQSYRILLESQAGEHGARMSAMENATKNAGEMIYKLTLDYNKQRQAGITRELLEIIGGSESQKSGA